MKIYYPNGDYYEGEVAHERRHGRGIYKNSMTIYDGIFKDDILVSGKIVQVLGDNAVKIIESDSFNSLMPEQIASFNARVLLLVGDRQTFVYQGGILNDTFHGKGVLQTDEYFYDGSFVAGVREGDGTLHNIAGNWEYVGGFRAGHYEGTGEFKSRECRYKGMFRAGLIEGSGHLEAGGYQMTGIFKPQSLLDSPELKIVWNDGNWADEPFQLDLYRGHHECNLAQLQTRVMGALGENVGSDDDKTGVPYSFRVLDILHEITHYQGVKQLEIAEKEMVITFRNGVQLCGALSGMPPWEDQSGDRMDTQQQVALYVKELVSFQLGQEATFVGRVSYPDGAGELSEIEIQTNHVVRAKGSFRDQLFQFSFSLSGDAYEFSVGQFQFRGIVEDSMYKGTFIDSLHNIRAVGTFDQQFRKQGGGKVFMANGKVLECVFHDDEPDLDQQATYDGCNLCMHDALLVRLDTPAGRVHLSDRVAFDAITRQLEDAIRQQGYEAVMSTAQLVFQRVCNTTFTCYCLTDQHTVQLGQITNFTVHGCGAIQYLERRVLEFGIFDCGRLSYGIRAQDDTLAIGQFDTVGRLSLRGALVTLGKSAICGLFKEGLPVAGCKYYYGQQEIHYRGELGVGGAYGLGELFYRDKLRVYGVFEEDSNFPDTMDIFELVSRVVEVHGKVHHSLKAIQDELGTERNQEGPLECQSHAVPSRSLALSSADVLAETMGASRSSGKSESIAPAEHTVGALLSASYEAIRACNAVVLHVGARAVRCTAIERLEYGGGALSVTARAGNAEMRAGTVFHAQFGHVEGAVPETHLDDTEEIEEAEESDGCIRVTWEAAGVLSGAGRYALEGFKLLDGVVQDLRTGMAQKLPRWSFTVSHGGFGELQTGKLTIIGRFGQGRRLIYGVRQHRGATWAGFFNQDGWLEGNGLLITAELVYAGGFAAGVPQGSGELLLWRGTHVDLVGPLQSALKDRRPGITGFRRLLDAVRLDEVAGGLEDAGYCAGTFLAGAIQAPGAIYRVRRGGTIVEDFTGELQAGLPAHGHYAIADCVIDGERVDDNTWRGTASCGACTVSGGLFTVNLEAPSVIVLRGTATFAASPGVTVRFLSSGDLPAALADFVPYFAEEEETVDERTPCDVPPAAPLQHLGPVEPRAAEDLRISGLQVVEDLGAASGVRPAPGVAATVVSSVSRASTARGAGPAPSAGAARLPGWAEFLAAEAPLVRVEGVDGVRAFVGALEGRPRELRALAGAARPRWAAGAALWDGVAFVGAFAAGAPAEGRLSEPRMGVHFAGRFEGGLPRSGTVAVAARPGDGAPAPGARWGGVAALLAQLGAVCGFGAGLRVAARGLGPDGAVDGPVEAAAAGAVLVYCPASGAGRLVRAGGVSRVAYDRRRRACAVTAPDGAAFAGAWRLGGPARGLLEHPGGYAFAGEVTHDGLAPLHGTLTLRGGRLAARLLGAVWPRFARCAPRPQPAGDLAAEVAAGRLREPVRLSGAGVVVEFASNGSELRAELDGGRRLSATFGRPVGPALADLTGGDDRLAGRLRGELAAVRYDDGRTVVEESHTGAQLECAGHRLRYTYATGDGTYTGPGVRYRGTLRLDPATFDFAAVADCFVEGVLHAGATRASGQFAAGLLDGVGVLADQSGVRQGEFRAGTLVKGIYRRADGVVFEV